MMELKITKTKKILPMVFAMIFIQVSFQMELTDLLSMKRRSAVDRKKAQIPQAMLSLYEKQMNHEYDTTALPLPGRLTRSANTVRSYTHQESPIDSRFLHSHTFRLFFDLTDFPANETVTSSELRLTIVPSENRSIDCSHQRVNVYDLVQPGIKGKSKPIKRIVDTKLVNTSDTTGVSLDVLPVIERWLSDHRGNNYGLLIEVRSPTGDKVASPHVRLKRSPEQDDDQRWSAAQPLLFLYSEDPKVRKPTLADWSELKRRKRSSGSTQPKGRKRGRDECRRHPLWVDFDRVGWDDWIVAPPGYEAYYCAGNCPTELGDHLNSTNHAIVQSLVHSVHPMAIPKPCCVPTTLSSISMLYLDQNNKAVLKNYRDMVVDGCGCR